jgi:hypothetical protein
MIKLKDILLEGKPPSIFIPRRIEDRVERLIKNYIRNGSKGNLNLSDLKLTKLPDIIKDITVGGNFSCSYNKLTSLAGSPSSVGEDFYCGHNKLKSLEGAPKYVSNDFLCNNNLLTSLEGAPKSIGGDFYCRDNRVKFTQQDVRAVCDVKGRVYL